MQQQYGTRQVAQALGIRPSTLSRAIWDGKVTPPAKGPGGAYVWTVPDIEAAAWVMKRFRQFQAWQEGIGND